MAREVFGSDVGSEVLNNVNPGSIAQQMTELANEKIGWLVQNQRSGAGDQIYRVRDSRQGGTSRLELAKNYGTIRDWFPVRNSLNFEDGQLMSARLGDGSSSYAWDPEKKKLVFKIDLSNDDQVHRFRGEISENGGRMTERAMNDQAGILVGLNYELVEYGSDPTLRAAGMWMSSHEYYNDAVFPASDLDKLLPNGRSCQLSELVSQVINPFTDARQGVLRGNIFSRGEFGRQVDWRSRLSVAHGRVSFKGRGVNRSIVGQAYPYKNDRDTWLAMVRFLTKEGNVARALDVKLDPNRFQVTMDEDNARVQAKVGVEDVVYDAELTYSTEEVEGMQAWLADREQVLKLMRKHGQFYGDLIVNALEQYYRDEYIDNSDEDAGE